MLAMIAAFDDIIQADTSTIRRCYAYITADFQRATMLHGIMKLKIILPSAAKEAMRYARFGARRAKILLDAVQDFGVDKKRRRFAALREVYLFIIDAS